MKKILFTFCFCICSFILFLSCSDDNTVEPNPTNPDNPKIVNVTPSSALLGQEITISGVQFGSERNNSYVAIGSILISDPSAFSFWSADSIKLFIPNNAVSGKIYVMVDNKKSNEWDYVISTTETISPTISQILPDSANVGDNIEIFGSGFSDIRKANYIDFNGVAVKEFSQWSDTKIKLQVPAGAISGSVTVHARGNLSNGYNYRIIGSQPSDPVITSLSKIQANINTDIEIYGKNFGVTQGTNYVQFNLATGQVYKSWSDTKIVVTVPAGAISGYITVNINNKASNGVNLNIIKIEDPTAPFIEYIDKDKGFYTELIGIHGKRFGNSQGTSYVEFNGTKSINYTKWTDTLIIAEVPSYATSGNIIVWVDNKPSNGTNFTIHKQNYVVSEVLIPAGQFIMGSNEGDEFDDFFPAHNVSITFPFFMSTTEITQKQWSSVMSGSNPSHPDDLGENKPVQQVTWRRAIEFCNKLSKMTNLTQCYTIVSEDSVYCNFDANGFRLPTEAEWEYACRAGSNGNIGSSKINMMGWTAENAGAKIHEVAQKQPNAFGLYDMYGNVAEWCWDLHEDDYYTISPGTNPTGPDYTGFPLRIIRGGSYQNGSDVIEPHKRYNFPGSALDYSSDLGFRVVRKK